jgi:RHS repeat-associated protein
MSTNAYRFAGEQQDSESGLYYLRARYFDPRVGRFISRDPLPGDARRPLSEHEYLYAQANPVNFRDPRGLQVPTSLTELTVALREFSGECRWGWPRC